jgi:hypothetical protein
METIIETSTPHLIMKRYAIESYLAQGGMNEVFRD